MQGEVLQNLGLEPVERFWSVLSFGHMDEAKQKTRQVVDLTGFQIGCGSRPRQLQSRN
jgi:hypothetical protein